MTPLPVASSSRLRLDAPVPPPPPPSYSIRKRRALRRSANVVAFVLALSAPYLAAAAPTDLSRASTRGHNPHTTRQTPDHANLSSRIVNTAVIGTLRLLQTAVRATGTLFRREEGQRGWPYIDTFSVVTRAIEPIAAKNDVEYYQLIPIMSPGFIVLSYLIALVGSLCTLELLIRRTSNRGASNLVLLASAGICFGAVSTFAMHFVGNQSLSLHFPDVPGFEDNQPLYLAYQAGYTVLSLVASCLAMIFAFFVMGTDISFRSWRSWPCVPGRRDNQFDDYAHWKSQKSRLNKTSNMSSILQQAGMVAGNWPMSESSDRKGWKDWFLHTPPVDSPVTFEPNLPHDEDSLVKHDKELCEIDFRLGRGAVREAIDRRQVGQGATPADSPLPSRQPSVADMESSLPDLPSSPLAAYYPTGGAIRDNATNMPPPPIDVRRAPSPNYVFAPGYQFPPRTPTDSDSTAALIPRPEKSAGNAPWTEISLDQHTPAVRRPSLPPLNPPPRSLPYNTLSRIQSLPEQDGDSPPVRDSLDGKDEGQRHSGSDETTDQERHELVYEDDDDRTIGRSGWRTRLREKVQAGLPLSTLEKIERFFGLDVVTWTDVIKISLTGMFAGWGVAAMLSITGIPYIAYHVAYVVGSVIIASGAVIIALYIMFIMLRPKLKHSWISKIGVAIILAGAVCGMHYSAMMGTIYGWDVGRKPSQTSNNSTKRAITGLVAALAFIACLGVSAFIMINSIRDRKERARRRRVVVASVLLDDQDRMLVSAIDGLLPMCDIASLTPAASTNRDSASLSSPTKSAHSSTLGVDLTTGNDAFVQAMKMTWGWRNPFWGVNPYSTISEAHSSSGAHSDFVFNTPSVSGDVHPPTPPINRRNSSLTAAESLSSAIAASREGISRFLDKFTISATQLSVRLTGQTEGISRLGVLYDQILTTGWVRLPNGQDTVSKGQLIFLVRRVKSSQERSDLLSRHFIFADPTSVATSLHKTLSTPFEHVMPFLEDMRSFCDNTMRMTLRPNTLYAGVTIVQATPFDGLRILLNNRNRSQLPMREVCTFSTLPGLPVNVAEGLAGTLDEIGEAVTWLDGMNLLSVMTRNMSAEATRVGGPRVGRLLAALERAVVPMLDELLSIDDMAYILPRLQLHPVLVPLTPAAPPRKGTPGWAAPHIIVFYANYDVAVNTFGDAWLPFKLFRAQHECVMASKIGTLTRSTLPSNLPFPREPSPALSPSLSISSLVAAPDPSRYNYARRPSKVQFEVPHSSEHANTTYTFPPRENGSATQSQQNGHANRNSSHSGGGSPSTTTSFPTWSSRDRGPPRRSSLARSLFNYEASEPHTPTPARAGVAQWDPNWLINLLRTRLRAEA